MGRRSYCSKKRTIIRPIPKAELSRGLPAVSSKRSRRRGRRRNKHRDLYVDHSTARYASITIRQEFLYKLVPLTPGRRRGASPARGGAQGLGSEPSVPNKVAIIGAGMAGLSCARSASAGGLCCRCLRARPEYRRPHRNNTHRQRYVRSRGAVPLRAFGRFSRFSR